MASTTRNIRDDLLLFFDRPAEPCFMPKGDEKVVFQIPESYYPEDFKQCVNTYIKAAKRVIKIKEIKLPDLSLPMKLPRHESFSFFLLEHRKMARRLIEIFMGVNGCEELLSIAAYCQLNLNPYLFNYCLSVTILHKTDTRGLDLPTYAEMFPDRFVDRGTMIRARELCSVLPETLQCPVIDIAVPQPKLPEQRLDYWREDIGLNSHHWHWHLIYPTDASDASMVSKDRRGELFFYMHHQVLARYDAERLCNGLERTVPYENFREPIAEGYFPRMDTINASRSWVPRYENMTIRDMDRSSNKAFVKLTDLDTWRDRIFEAIKNMAIETDKGESIVLDEETGINYLANIVEATSMSVNNYKYGDYHNQVHNLIAYVHDPYEHYSEANTVMGDSGTAMRDPVFYRLHRHIDNIFITFKNKFAPYTTDKLDFRDVVVSSVSIKSAGGQDTQNTIETMWERSVMNLRNGMDFRRRCNVYARFTHLQHDEFTYEIEVENKTSSPQIGTFRIFMAPVADQDGNPLTFDEQRHLMIEMDKFSQPLMPGRHPITRRSIDSSVTIPFERIFRDQTGPPGVDGAPAPSEYSFCDCGWPQYMLVPKGTKEGYPMVVFVMITNWNEDKVNEVVSDVVKNNASYCGLRDLKYPDKRPMGFPFDRKAEDKVQTLKDFLTPNMGMTNCTIKFTDTTRDRPQKIDTEGNTSGNKPGRDSRQCGWPRQCQRSNTSDCGRSSPDSGPSDGSGPDCGPSGGSSPDCGRPCSSSSNSGPGCD